MNRKWSRLAVVALIALTVTAKAGTWHVRNGGDDTTGDGASWGAAWATIGKALSVATNGETVLVSNGTYLITAELALTNGITLTGIGGAAETVVARTGSGNHRIFRIAHGAAVLDGFTVANGYVTGTAPANNGSGIYMSPGGTVVNCRVVGNNAPNGAVGRGGGIYMTGGMVSNCVVWSNGVYTGSGENRITEGGGVYMTGGMLVDSAIVSNLAYNAGLGLYVTTGTVDRCRIAGNYGDNRGYSGGGFYVATTGGVVRNSLIAYNRSRYGGGGWMQYGTLDNCTVVSNSASSHTGGIYATNTTVVRNTILALNDGPPMCRDYSPGSGSYQYCCASPLIWGEGNIDADPQFINPRAGDFHIRPGSACLNGGTNLPGMEGAKDLDGSDRLPDARVDIGPYETTPGPLRANAIASSIKAFEPADIVFTACADGTNTASLTYYWDFNGDGTQEIAGADARVVTNRYAAGTHTVIVTITNGAGEGATAVKSAYVKVAPPELFVRPSGVPVFPYTNWATASTNVQLAVDAGIDGSTVRVTDGVYEVTAAISLTEGVTLRSENGAMKTALTQKNTRFTASLSHANAVVDGFTINRKGASAYGGVQIIQLGTVQNCRIAGNRDDQGAGPVNITGGGLVTDCVIVTNSSRYYGGVRLLTQAGNGIFGVSRLENCTIISNAANHSAYTVKGYTGGVRADAPSLIRNCVIAGNLSFGFDGGAYLDGATMENCTIVGNVASNADATSVGGLRAVNKAVVRNTLITDNTNIVTGSAANWYREGGTIEYSCTTPSASAYGVGNITALPEFMNAPTGDYRLAAASPGVNQGTNVAWMLTATDLAGNPRIGQNRVDMGAYERLAVFTGSIIMVK